ncbi:DNA repair metallo-beta-lactamase-domain-containing protein [Truncatella angustata]|uniref:DNA repair metallo-beta-lactamase-domain-containing protein n=1 Tax=Truncatella angustata TaxID=152316 RepID=A0A9P8RIC6_9PEZI|nr:DNA repair metallo-beta-lactamase-domain-containing protein [Truncatella angustata]KAH6646379.1 DNA repair metallo-beta-lactamase-domain-containing protein [Truncatella angustata]
MPSKAISKPKTPRQTKLNFSAAANGANSKSAAKKQKSNGNILNFFKKVEVDEQLFLEQGPGPSNSLSILESEVKSEETKDGIDDLFGDAEDDETPSRFNEEQASFKRRKLSHDAANGVVLPQDGDTAVKTENGITGSQPAPSSRKKNKKTRKGPFLDDSDSENDVPMPSSPTRQETKGEPPDDIILNEVTTAESPPIRPELLRDESCSNIPKAPELKQEDSVYDNFRTLEEMGQGFDGELDSVEEGEEYRYMRFAQEQARIEAEEAGFAPDEDFDEAAGNDSMVESCPICSASLAGVTADQATTHVNACLDGTSIPVPAPEPVNQSPENAVEVLDISKRFTKAAVPRPGQANPITLGSGAGESSTAKSGSAFSKLMSSHAEDTAWAQAAATEHASRGKYAYERTCPFYKIMPGFYICVDAFRYGAVKGCNAYFLSHFHSDHYVGLTANWTHGPIYCSKVTGSLIKSQLKTAAKWVREIEFEETLEIPGTEGATVTMIPANHCPGSSLFLFEKAMGMGPNPRKQRILHCGDFRACTAQVKHPLLKPDVVDSISGKTRQQKIDICYLDTTYMNPRYSFPPQDDVINACADFCRSISGDPNALDDAFDAIKREKGTEPVSKFFTKEPSKGDSDQTTPETPKQQHRLLVVCGTYSIGKERICKAIAQALNTKIYASAAKIRLCKQLGDPELSALMTSNPREGQVHMQMLMEIRAETLQEYLNGYKAHGFSRIVGFRPSGWNFRNPQSNAKTVSANLSPSSVPMPQILHGPAWRTRFGAADFVAQRGSTREAMCFGVPYSEHSSFRELALFTMSLRIEKIVPTVNVGSEQSRKRMKGWLDRWVSERRRGGVVGVLEEEDEQEEELPHDADTDADASAKIKNGKEKVLWEGKDGRGGGAVW